MIHSLRKRHRFNWLILSILLPVGFVAAWRVPKVRVLQNFQENLLPEAYPNLLKETENDVLKLNLRGDGKAHYQLEVLLKKPVKLPAPVLYLNLNGKESIEGNQPLTSLGAAGLYRFPLKDQQIKGVFFYSPLNGKIAHQSNWK